MKIEKIVVGFLRTNCYLLTIGDDCLIVDPGADYNIIKERIGALNVLGILVTHHHPDHVWALTKIRNAYKAPVYDYKTGTVNCSVGSFTFDIIENKGHTKDSVTFYFKEDKVMLVGDFIFKGTVGRTDLPSGSDIDMRESLKLRKEYEPDIKLYPGHGHETNLGYEIEHNPYFKNI